MNLKPARLPVRGAHLSAVLLLALFAAAAFAPPTAHAQDLDDVTISGRVADQNGAIIPNATITTILVKTGVERTAVADDDGRYRIIELEPGEYTVRASSEGFATEEKTN